MGEGDPLSIVVVLKRLAFGTEWECMTQACCCRQQIASSYSDTECAGCRFPNEIATTIEAKPKKRCFHPGFGS